VFTNTFLNTVQGFNFFFRFLFRKRQYKGTLRGSVGRRCRHPIGAGSRYSLGQGYVRVAFRWAARDVAAYTKFLYSRAAVSKSPDRYYPSAQPARTTSKLPASGEVIRREVPVLKHEEPVWCACASNAR